MTDSESGAAPVSAGIDLVNEIQFRQDAEVIAADGYRTDVERRLARVLIEKIDELRAARAREQRVRDLIARYRDAKKPIYFPDGPNIAVSLPELERAILDEETADAGN